jgi:hypothetical protein
MPDSFAVYLKVIIEADNAKVVTLAADRIPWSESPYGAVEVGYDQP